MIPFYAANETSSENTDGDCLVLYFEKRPTPDQVVEAVKYVKDNNKLLFPCAQLIVDTEDECFSYEAVPTPVSEKAGLVRLECYGSY
jgi:hypothetical protein